MKTTAEESQNRITRPPISHQGKLATGWNEDLYKGLTKKGEDQNLSGDIRMAEDKAKLQNILKNVGVEDQPAFDLRDQLPAHMEAYKCLITSYVEPLWVTSNKKGSLQLNSALHQLKSVCPSKPEELSNEDDPKSIINLFTNRYRSAQDTQQKISQFHVLGKQPATSIRGCATWTISTRKKKSHPKFCQYCQYSQKRASCKGAERRFGRLQTMKSSAEYTADRLLNDNQTQNHNPNTPREQIWRKGRIMKKRERK